MRSLRVVKIFTARLHVKAVVVIYDCVLVAMYVLHHRAFDTVVVRKHFQFAYKRFGVVYLVPE